MFQEAPEVMAKTRDWNNCIPEKLNRYSLIVSSSINPFNQKRKKKLQTQEIDTKFPIT